MQIGVPKESAAGERRVGLTPAVMPALHKAGYTVAVERGAGMEAGFADSLYEGQGVQLTDRGGVFSGSDLIVRVQGLGNMQAPGNTMGAAPSELELYKPGQLIVGLLDPLGSPHANLTLAGRGVTTFAVELLPRITRAQSMDVLSSMATITGYKGVILAADALPKLFPMMMTAAGTYAPAKVLVVGAGVAGLQAIATARRLGAAVLAYDVRAASKEQVESLGAKFLELPLETKGAEGTGGYAVRMDEDFYRKQRELMAKAVADSDAVIATAQVPGSKAPVLITAEMVQAMRPGSVIVDLAAETGGNCALTKPGESIVVSGVTIMGPLNLVSTAANQASQMYARNITAFLVAFAKDGQFHIDQNDPIIKATLVASGGEVVQRQVRERLNLPAPARAGESAKSG